MRNGILQINRLRDRVNGRTGKAVYLLLSLVLVPYTASLFLEALEEIDGWFPLWLNDSAACYFGCCFLLQLFLTWFFLGSRFSSSTLITLFEIGAFLIILFPWSNADAWIYRRQTLINLLFYAAVMITVLIFTWQERCEQNTKCLLWFLNTVYALIILNISLVQEDFLLHWERILFRTVVAVILLAFSWGVLSSAIGAEKKRKAFVCTALLACVVQAAIWINCMDQEIFRPFPYGIIPLREEYLVVQGVLTANFGVAVCLAAVRTKRSDTAKLLLSGRTEEGSGSERKILLRSTRKAVLVIVLFAAVISIVQLAQRDKRWKHLDTLLRTGELEEAVAWMDMHPGDIPEQTEYKNRVLACMDYERPWVFCGGNIMLISSEGEIQEGKPVPVFIPEVSFRGETAAMEIKDENGNCMFRMFAEETCSVFADDLGMLIYEANQDENVSPKDYFCYYLTKESDNCLLFLQYDMDLDLRDYCEYRAEGSIIEENPNPELRDPEIRQRWATNPFYEKKKIIGG